MTNEEYYDFKCRGCGEKFTDEFASANDVALCKWCNGEMDIPVVDEDYGCVVGQHQDYHSPIFHKEKKI